MKKQSGTYTRKATTISRNEIYPEGVPEHMIAQFVRKASGTSSGPDLDPDFRSFEQMEYGQSDSIAGNGSHRGYSVDTYKNGDKTYQKYEGTHKTIVKEGGAWELNYEGKFQYTGGTGTFKNIKGGGAYKGRVTAEEQTDEGTFESEY